MDVGNNQTQIVKPDSLFSMKSLIVALIFGGLALTIVMAGIHFPIPGTDVVSDPRESFVTLGAAFTGPIGAIVIGILAGIAEPGGLAFTSIFAHLLGALWISIVYKNIIIKFSGVMMFFSWIVSVLAYYFIFVVTGFTLGLKIFNKDPGSMVENYRIIASGVSVEVFITVVVTFLILFALPKKYRIPLW